MSVSNPSAPPGNEFAPNFFLEDIYDGDEEEAENSLDGSPRLVNGLGVLSDGLFGGNMSLSHQTRLSSGKSSEFAPIRLPALLNLSLYVKN